MTTNFEPLQQLSLFDTNVIKTELKKDKGKLVDFKNATSFSPYLLDYEHYNCISQERVDRLPFFLDGTDQVHKPESKSESMVERLKKHGNLIKPSRINFDKPIVVIWNPSSGKKRDCRQELQQAISGLGVECKILATEEKGAKSGWRIV